MTAPQHEGESTPPHVIVGPAEAVTAFMEWLVSQPAQAGPFSSRQNVGQGKRWAAAFCMMQGWQLPPGDEWREQIKKPS